MQAQRLPTFDVAFGLEFLRFGLDFFVVLAILLGVLGVLLAHGFVLHAGEQIAGDFRIVAPDGLRLVVRPLVGRFLLFEQFFGRFYMPQNGYDRQDRGEDRHGSRDHLVERFFGVFGVLMQFFGCGHRVHNKPLPICYRDRMLRLLIVGLAACALAVAQPSDVKTGTLDNGMRILVQEDHNIPNVAMYFFYRIGSRNEHPGATGLSHFFEHMMFNGAKKYGFGQFDFNMEKNGGNNNAYTTSDDTVYQDWFPSKYLENMLEMEADRIRDLSFDPKVIESERGVVYSERRSSVDNSNFGILYEQLHAAAFTAHPYHWPVVGWPSDIEAWTMDDLKNHFRMGYAPNNCTMVVVGDVSTPEVFSLAKKYIEPIPRQEPPPPVRTKEPEQIGERRVTVVKAAQLPIEMIAYHVPAASNADDAPLDVLETILTHGQSSRLFSRLVDKDQLVINVNTSRPTSFDPTLLTITMTPRSGVDPARAEKSLFEELDKLRNEPVGERELRKAKNQLLADHYRQLKTINGRANLLGQYDVFYGDYRKLYTVEQTVEAVTAADVQRVAKFYLTEKNRTVATLIPESKSSRSPDARGGQE